MQGSNQKITAVELSQIRSLDDFDLKMLISEIHDYGWPGLLTKKRWGFGGKSLLASIMFTNNFNNRNQGSNR